MAQSPNRRCGEGYHADGGVVSAKAELSPKERADGIIRLANHIGCGFNPHMIADMFLWMAVGHPAVNPVLLEKWLVKTGKYHPDMCDESIEECMVRVYGKEWADLAKSLL